MMSIAELTPSRSEDRWRDSPEAGPSTYPLADEVEPRVAIRVLVSFEEEYHAYGDAIAGALGDLRPRAEVAVAEPVHLPAEVARTSPHLVISSLPRAADPARTLAWVELPYEPGAAGTICFGGECLEAYGLDLGDLLAVIDRAEIVVGA
jgi:hypothetical protein